MARPIAKDYDDKRRHILTIAAAVFAKDGFSRASMNQVAQACGVSKATIYHYYESKDALVFDILDTYLASLRDSVFALRMDGLNPAQQLHAVTRQFLLAYDGMDNEHKMLTEGLHWLPDEQREPLKLHQRQMVKYVSDVLVANAPGSLGDDPKLLRQSTMSIFGMLNWFYQWNPRATTQDRVAYAAAVANLALNGLAR